MKASSAKAKGRRCAAEVRKLMLQFTDLHEDDIMVTPAGVHGPDLQLSPAAQRVYPIAVECKNVEAIQIWAALKQAESHSGDRDWEPVLFFKRNRSKLYAAIDAETLLELIRRH